MARIIKPRAKSRGLPPGSLVYISNRPHPDVKINVTNFNIDMVQEKQVSSIEECVEEVRDPVQ